MGWYKNLKITTKLISGFIIVVLLTALVGYIGIRNVNEVDSNSQELYEHETVPLARAGEMGKLFQRIRVNVRDMVLEDDLDLIEEHYQTIQEIIEEINTQGEEFKTTIQTDEIEEAYTQFEATRVEFRNQLAKLYELATSNRDSEAFELIKGDMRTAADAERDMIEQLIVMKVEEAGKKNEANAVITSSATTSMLILIIISVVVGILLGVIISKVIGNPLKQMLVAANEIAEGNLDVNLSYASKDEVGELAKAFRKMTSKINLVMGNINAAAEQVASGSKQVSDSSVSLSQGATEQASSIEELTASIEEIASQTRMNAASAEEAKEIAGSAQKYAEIGNDQMKDMLSSMEEINESSSNISKIIKVIDDIAFQTNILALNAAVEAARAGQHGKGFAVVAEEVRNLAARSANAANETTTMIEGSINKVEGGTKIARETAEALNKIVEGVSKAASLVSDIAVASSEQASGVDQINQGISQISDVVQTTSATAEETAASSQELSSQAELLKGQVSNFKLKDMRSNDFYGDEDMDPKVYEMLNQMEKKSGHGSKSKKISLSDSDFDKY